MSNISIIPLESWLPILPFFAVALVLSMFLVFIGWILSPSRPDKEKLSSYECGFEAFDEAQQRFDIRFYLVTLLFIIFDLEIAFLFPWATALEALGTQGFVVVMIFLGILTVGFIYEWKKGALDWE